MSTFFISITQSLIASLREKVGISQDHCLSSAHRHSAVGEQEQNKSCWPPQQHLLSQSVLLQQHRLELKMERLMTFSMEVLKEEGVEIPSFNTVRLCRNWPLPSFKDLSFSWCLTPYFWPIIPLTVLPHLEHHSPLSPYAVLGNET